ncbi:hypothetical protein CANCADRAFT_1583 [Tortispora caseinolytica NRRL Y-17796]|uniref:Uncharacterized protein n=1 Tax=Tortispora caseinolytica NRRL Y-17796 TaxID=767744 RepID=A0A1E4TDW1_9ASCO|nr:hypothetical protein CANCADRAFT_1583 [Tortispora caseinolytica NRRL Y-17796]
MNRASQPSSRVFSETFEADNGIPPVIAKTINKHLFNQSLEVLVPDSRLELPTFKRCDLRIPLKQLLLPTNVDAIRACDYFYAISGGSIETGDVVCITKSTVYLSLCKDTYQRAGLEGRRLTSKSKDYRYLVQFELSVDNFLYKRLHTVAGDALQHVDVFSLSYQGSLPWTSTSPNTAEIDLNLAVPDFALVETGTGPDLSEIYEWLGLVSLESPRVTPDDVIDPVFSTYAVSDPRSMPVTKSTIQQNVPSDVIIDVINKLHSSSCTWWAVQVRGYTNSALTFNNQPHQFGMNGESHYSIVYFKSSNSSTYMLFTQRSFLDN